MNATKHLAGLPETQTMPYCKIPTTAVSVQSAVFGVSGHCGSTFKVSLNDW